MAANRVVDREIDARNPRTDEPRAGHRRGVGAHGVVGTVVALSVFLAAAAALSWLCLLLAPLAVVPLCVYPYGKRFTELPARHPRRRPGGGADRAAWIAVTGDVVVGRRLCWVSPSAPGSAAST